MVQNGAQIDVKDEENKTPLYFARKKGHIAIEIYLKNPNMAEEEVNKMATEIEARKQAEKEVMKKAEKEAKKGLNKKQRNRLRKMLYSWKNMMTFCTN